MISTGDFSFSSRRHVEWMLIILYESISSTKFSLACLS